MIIFSLRETDSSTNLTKLKVVQNLNCILLILAMGKDKTYIAFQIVWKLFKNRWTICKDGTRLSRILFLTDRNILAG
jgi:type I restriction enzyme R subunit